MATNYSLKGEKGHRQVVKTIDIHEESYNAINKMLGSGENLTDDVVGPIIDDTYKMFGGNCYRELVSLSISSLITEVVKGLERMKLLSKRGDEAYIKILESIFPTMCYVKDEDGAAFKELRFFNTDTGQIISEVVGCLDERIKNLFSMNLMKAMSECTEPAGEIALGILLHISIDDATTKQAENEKEAN